MPKKINSTMLLVILLIASIIYFCIKMGIRFNAFQKQLAAVKIEQMDFSKVRNGTFDGLFDLKFVSAKVKVEVADGKVTRIDLLQHKHGPSKKYGAEKIVDKIISQQTLNVDAVSGATGSSTVIKKAVETALKQGL